MDVAWVKDTVRYLYPARMNLRVFLERNKSPFPPILITLIAMAVKNIQLGQVWRNDANGKNYLVTKLYSEVFSQFAMLRQADAQAANVDTVRVKVQKTADTATLPGYTYTQDATGF